MNKKYSALIIPYSLFLIPLMALGISFDRDLTVGSRGVDVESLQNFLTEQRAYSGPVTGYFGNLTKEGVRKFQENNSITPVAGYFGPKTRALANQKLSGGAGAFFQAVSAPILTIAELQKQIEVLTAELQKLQAAPVALPSPVVEVPATAIPAPITPAQFSGSVKIFSIYPNVTLSGYADVALNEYQLSGSDYKVAVTKLRLTNTGTLSDVYFNEIRLVNSANNEVLAKVDAPVEKVIEFILTPDSSKKDNGLMVSGGVYAVRATLKTPSSGSERKLNIKLDILSSGDITAVDFDTLSRPADISGNTFPIEGPYVTTF